MSHKNLVSTQKASDSAFTQEQTSQTDDLFLDLTAPAPPLVEHLEEGDSAKEVMIEEMSSTAGSPTKQIHAPKSKEITGQKNPTSIAEIKKAIDREFSEKMIIERGRLEEEMRKKLADISATENFKKEKLDRVVEIVFRTKALNAPLSEIERVLEKLAKRFNGKGEGKAQQKKGDQND